MSLPFTALLLSLPSLAQAPPPIVGGEDTTRFPAVGVLVAYNEDRGGAAFCSGSLIAREWVLTAGHCLEAADIYAESGFDTVFAVGTNIYEDDGVIDAVWAEDWVSHPDYSGMDTLPVRYDAGLIELRRPVDGVDPLRLNAAAPDHSWAGRDLDYVGWGITDDDARDAGIKRHVQVTVGDWDSGFLYTLDEGRNVCSGDSGGAAIVSLDGGGRVLAGINSFVFAVGEGEAPCAEGGAGATRVDGLLDWISQEVPVEEEGGVAWVDGERREGGGGLPTESSGACSGLPARPASIVWAVLGLAAAMLRRERDPTEAAG